ncbi:MAG: hypothetical protein QGI77_02970, partial [Roseibacillus sp.]|nr:hypothetical protein [Roseibacillus sp.]
MNECREERERFRVPAGSLPFPVPAGQDIASALLGRRSFLQTSAHGFGALALGSLLFDEQGEA